MRSELGSSLVLRHYHRISGPIVWTVGLIAASVIEVALPTTERG